MTESVDVTVRNSLGKVIEDLGKIREMAEKTGESFKDVGKGVDDGLKNNTKNTETYFSNVRNLSRRLADQLRGDFKSLLSLNAIQDSLKISNQFRGAVRETTNLADAIRKLGPIFGMATGDFAGFQSKLTKGLGDIGLGASVATNVLKGLSTTQVRGQDNILDYTKRAGALASIGGEQGKEGDIAAGMANVIQAKGGNVNDPKQMEQLADELLKVRNQTGQTPTESLKVLQDAFAHMATEMQNMPMKAMSSIMTLNKVGGPGTTSFIEHYLKLSPIDKMPYEQRGGGALFDKNGLNLGAFKKFMSSVKSDIPGDPRKSLMTLPGVGEEEADGIIKLLKHMPEASEAIDKVNNATVDLIAQMRESFSLTEAYRSNINKVSSSISGFIANISQKAKELLTKTSETTAGATGVAAASAIVAALLGGGGVKGLASSFLRGKSAEMITGKEVIPVEVTNFPIGFGGGGGVAGAAEAAGALGAAGLGSLVLPLTMLTASIGALAYVKNGIDGDIANAGKSPTTVKYDQATLDTMRKALEAGHVPEGQVDNIKQILKEQDVTTQRGNWRPVMPTVTPGGGEGKATHSATPGKGGQAFPGSQRDIKVRVELNSPQLKETKSANRGGTL